MHRIQEEMCVRMMEDLKTVKGLVLVQDKQIDTNKKKIVDLTARSMANNAVIMGLLNDTPEEDCKHKVLTLFRKEMKMEVEDTEVVEVHRLGPIPKDKRARPTVVRCTQALRKGFLSLHPN